MNSIRREHSFLEMSVGAGQPNPPSYHSFFIDGMLHPLQQMKGNLRSDLESLIYASAFTMLTGNPHFKEWLHP